MVGRQEDRPSGSNAFALLEPLAQALRRRAERLTRAGFDHVLDDVISDWRTWPVTENGGLTAGLIISALRICCASPRKDRRRSRSAHTLRWLLEELIRMGTVLSGRPVSSLERADVVELLNVRRAEARVGASLKWLKRACEDAGVKPPRSYRPS